MRSKYAIELAFLKKPSFWAIFCAALLVATELFVPERDGSLVSSSMVMDTGRFPFVNLILVLCGCCLILMELSILLHRKTSECGASHRSRGIRFWQASDKCDRVLGVMATGEVLLLFWLVVTSKLSILPSDILPTPEQVLQQLGLFHGFAVAGAYSAGRLILAFLLAAAGGISAGILLGRIPQTKYVLPFANMLAVFPPIVLAPFFYFFLSKALFSKLLGATIAGHVPPRLYDEAFRVAVPSFAAFWPIFAAALLASTKADTRFLNIAHGLGAGWGHRIKDVVLPLAIPSVVSSAKVSMTIGFIVLLYVEGVGAAPESGGLGFYVASFIGNSNNAPLFALVVVAALIIEMLTVALDLLQRVLAPWDRDFDRPGVDKRSSTATQISETRMQECIAKLISYRKKYKPGIETIKINSLTKSRGDRTVLCIDRPLAIASGQVVSIIGESGNGKTTLAGVLAGLQPYDKGEIWVNGDKLSATNRRIVPSVAYFYQDSALFPHMTVRRHLEYVYRYADQHLSHRDVSDAVNNALKLVGLEQNSSAYPAQLSGGERQRLALARTLITEAEILILDEALSNVDQPSKSLLRMCIRNLTKKLQLTTIYISHDREDVLQISDMIWYLREGTIVSTGTPQQLYYHPGSVETAHFLGHTNLFEGEMSDGHHVLLRKPLVSLARFTPSPVLEVRNGASDSPKGTTVYVCIPKNRTGIKIGTEEYSGLDIKTVVGEPRFSGTEWELRLQTACGLEADVLMSDAEYERFGSSLKSGCSMMLAVSSAYLVESPR